MSILNIYKSNLFVYVQIDMYLILLTFLLHEDTIIAVMSTLNVIKIQFS